MKRSSIIITSTACLAAAGSLCWYLIDSHDTLEVKTSSIAANSETPAPVEQKIEDYFQWLHPNVQITVSPEPLGYGERYNAYKALPNNLAAMDLQALMQFINGERPDEVQVYNWHALVDGIINVIRRQETAAAGFTKSLVRLYHDSEDAVLKDYAIQYLRHLYVDRDDTYKHETDPIATELILVTLIDAASKSSESYSGAALMGLHDATSSAALKLEPETQAQLKAHTADLNAVLIKSACSPETDKLCRISAIQVCALRGIQEILPAVRTMAADPNEDTNIRISAIAAIGQLGTIKEDQTLLKQLEQGGIRLAYAATPALKRLKD